MRSSVFWIIGAICLCCAASAYGQVNAQAQKIANQVKASVLEQLGSKLKVTEYVVLRHFKVTDRDGSSPSTTWVLKIRVGSTKYVHVIVTEATRDSQIKAVLVGFDATLADKLPCPFNMSWTQIDKEGCELQGDRMTMYKNRS